MLVMKERPIPPPLAFSVLIAVVVVVAGFAARFLLSIPGETVSGESWFGLLIAAAMWCGAALMVRRRETVAWLLSVGAAGLAAYRIYGLFRALEFSLGALNYAIPSVWPWLIPLVLAALIAAAAIAGAYAARTRDLGRRWVQRGVPIAVVLGLIVIVVTAVVALFTPVDPALPALRNLDVVRTAARWALAFVVLAALIGAARDLAGPMSRAQSNLMRQPLTRRGATITIFWRLLRDELFPSAAEERRVAIEEERARLAADLHALVLPELRRAAAAAEAAGNPDDPVHANLRSALADVEQLIQGRQSVVLEQFGLGAALEWLAERVEERSEVRVTIEEADTSWVGVGNRTLTEHMAAARQRAAFRVALLALDNVVRHAGARNATIRFGAAPRQFLSVTDDGSGMTATTHTGVRTGRGLADMRAEAVASGGNVEITSSSEGTKVEIAWGQRLAEPSATNVAATTDGSEPGAQAG
ncbi:MAG TPA: ATP-binding protein [Candidatus Limnocylindrales bacterium]|nr:ATP-binding protein [Candidatus Limnocylindrales bacterium]